MAEPQIRFTDGAADERMMGVWSRLAGEVFIDWLAPRSRLTMDRHPLRQWRLHPALGRSLRTGRGPSLASEGRPEGRPSRLGDYGRATPTSLVPSGSRR